jgi:hypothetical protein
MSFRVHRDYVIDTIQGLHENIVPTDPLDTTPPQGALKYNTIDNLIYYGSEGAWIPIASRGTQIVDNEGVGSGLVYDTLTGGVSYLRSLLVSSSGGSEGIEIGTVGDEIVIGSNITGTNVGPSPGPTIGRVFVQKNGSAQLEMRSLVAGINISLTETPTTVEIGASIGGGGISGVNNEGVGADVFDTITGSTVLLRRINGTSNGVTVTQNALDITIDNTLSATNLGASGGSVFSSKSGSNLQLRKIVGGSGITVTENTNDLTISYSSTTGGNSTIWRIYEEQPSGTHAGASLTGINIRTLNTIVSTGPSTSNVTLAASRITIQPGRYLIHASAPMHQTTGHRISLVNNVTNIVALKGTNAAAHSSATTHSIMSGFLQVATATVYRLEHYSTDSKATDGLGDAVAQIGETEIYADITITQVG